MERKPTQPIPTPRRGRPTKKEVEAREKFNDSGNDYHNIVIVQGRFNQADERFDSFSRGKQCTANAAVACAGLFIRRSNNWSSADIDEVLMVGDDLYRRSRAAGPGLAFDLGNNQYLTVAELCTSLVLFRTLMEFSPDESSLYYGNLTENRPPFPNLEGSFNRFFSNNNDRDGNNLCAVLTSNLKSVAVGKIGSSFFYFDSHSLDSTGRTAARGFATLMRFSDVLALRDAVIGNLMVASNDPTDINCNAYTLTPLNVRRVRAVEGDRVPSASRVPSSTTGTPVCSVDRPVVTPTKRTVSSQRCVAPKAMRTVDATSASEDVVGQGRPSRGKPSSVSSAAFIRRIETMNSKGGVPHYVGPLDVVCSFCGALFFPEETIECCKKGLINLQAVRYPSLLRDLLTGNHEHSKIFRRNIVRYNNMFAFASIGARLFKPPGVGPTMYIVQGLIYHQIRDVFPNAPAKYGQLYYLDPEIANASRAANNPDCPRDLLNEIDRLLREINPFAKVYKTLREAVQHETTRARVENVPSAYVHIQANRYRRYNRPEVDYEFAAVFEGPDGNVPNVGDLRVYYQNEPSRMDSLSATSPFVEPMVFPILFPYGESGWTFDLRYGDDANAAGSSAKSSSRVVKKRTKITCREHVLYRLSIRRDVTGSNSRFSSILNAGKLTQQYIVDGYVKVETDRLTYLRTNQIHLRAREYAGLHDYLDSAADRENVAVGRIVILPSTFTGSPRSMQQHFQDAMAIVAKFGRPDYFITFTCNPNWPEIIRNKLPYDEVSNRPDLVCRVFHEKFRNFLYELTVKGIFGTAAAYVYTVEFQKRGLPHVHLLLTVADEHKPRESEQIDAIVSAEIPDCTTDGQLYNLVTKHMIHGPCGEGFNEKSVCIGEDGKCGKKFPKRFAERTETRTGYPEYRRRDTGRTVSVQRANRVFDNVDNRFVVPYNKYLLTRYNAHVNVEVCHSIKSVKYVYDYVYKGHDCALLRIDISSGVYDETTQFVDSRYVGAYEAYWRVRAYTLQGTSHVVVRLTIHLPGQKNVYFEEGKEVAALEAAAGRHSMFEAWFELNRTDSFARGLFYHDIPYHYRFDSRHTYKWQKRQRHIKVISRIYSVSPKCTELFYLRMLLFHVRGPRSFEELRTANGTVCETFYEAARILGLTGDDAEWLNCIKEAIPVALPKRLRKLFVTMLAFCTVEDPLRIWNLFRDEFSHDFVRKGFDVETARQKALRSIKYLLRLAGVDYDTLRLPMIDGEPVLDESNDHHDSDDAELLNLYDLVADVVDNKTKFNAEQADIYRKIIDAVFRDDGHHPRLFFIDGPGGTGKTFLYNTLLAELQYAGKLSVAVAWTGIAAILLRGGRTVHSRFRLPFNVTSESSSGLTLDSEDAREIKRADLFVWDEISMTTVHAFNAVDRFLRALMCDDRPFGNKVVVVGGDFRQCLPVVPHSGRTKIIEACVINGDAWTDFTHVRLTRNMRADKNERRFSDWLLKLGEGALANPFSSSPTNDDTAGDSDYIQIPPECITANVIDDVYGGNFENLGTEIFANRTILTPTNEGCDDINNTILTSMSGSRRVYLSADSLDTDSIQEAANYPLEYINSLTPPGMPPHRLILKVGAPVMLLRNVSINEGLCNGTRLIVKRLGEHLIEVEIATGVFKGNRVFLHRMDLAADVSSGLPFPLKRRQYPIRVCFAITINKAQGQTFDTVGLYLERPVFSHGHLYVAFSRVRSFRSIKVQVKQIAGEQGRLLNDHRVFSRNVVYKSLLERLKQ